MTRRQIPLNPTKPFIQGWNRQFKHNDLSAGLAGSVQERLKPLFKFADVAFAEKIITANFNDDNGRIDGLLLKLLRGRTSSLSHSREILHSQCVAISENGRPLLGRIVPAIPSRDGITDHRDLSCLGFPQHWHDMVSGFMEPNCSESHRAGGGGNRGVFAEATREDSRGDRKQNEGISPIWKRSGRNRQGDQPNQEEPSRYATETRKAAGPEQNGDDKQSKGHKEGSTARDLKHDPVHFGSGSGSGLPVAECGRSAARDHRRTIPLDFIASPLHRFVRRLPSRETNLFHPVAPTFHNKTLVNFRSHEVKPVWNNPSRRARLNVRNVCQGDGKFVPLDVKAMRPE